METIEKLINEISDFVPGDPPYTIKIILGERGYSKGKTIEPDCFCSNSDIKIYKLFKEVAFIMDNASFSFSEIMVISILLGSIDRSVLFLNKLREDITLVNKFINYLYYKHGIILCNRAYNSENYIELIDGKASDLLILGSKYCGVKLERAINQNPNIRTGKILHCSSINVSWHERYYQTWFCKNDKQIEPTDPKHNVTSFKNFKII